MNGSTLKNRFVNGYFVPAVLLFLIGAVFSLAPQIKLWNSDLQEYHGIYAVNDLDEVAYAAYLKSLIDGKERRNAPYTGREDSKETPLEESLFSIQMLASYPIAFVARVSGLSISGAFVLEAVLYGGLTGLAVFWLFALLFEAPWPAFVGVVVVLSAGALAAGQGSIVREISPESIYYGIAFPFARRSVPLTGFPALFVFFGSAWLSLRSDDLRRRTAYTIAATIAFAFLVFSYFYLWTTAAAWLFILGVLILAIRPPEYRKYFSRMFVLASGMIIILLPYAFLLAGRSKTMDKVQLLASTRALDLFRPPELLGIAVAVGIVVLAVVKWAAFSDKKVLFCLSLALTGILVFNQQVLTGRSLQPVHYQLYVINYINLFALMILVLLFVTEIWRPKYHSKLLLLIALGGLYVGYLEFTGLRSVDGLRDNVVPVAEKIRELSTDASGSVLSFDLNGGTWPTSDEIPALASRSVLWAPHQRVFGDVSDEENEERFFYLLYFQGKDPDWLRQELLSGNELVEHGLFGWLGGHNGVLGDKRLVEPQMIEETVAKYSAFYTAFDDKQCSKYPISFVILPRFAAYSFETLDKCYERELVDTYRMYILFRTKPRRLPSP